MTLTTNSYFDTPISYEDWENGCRYVQFQINSTNRSYRKPSQIYYKTRSTAVLQMSKRIFFDKFILREQFYLADDVYYTLPYTLPKQIAGKRKWTFISLELFVVYCSYTCALIRITKSLRDNIRSLSKKSSSYYGAEFSFKQNGELDLSPQKHYFADYYKQYRSEVISSIPVFSVVIKIDFQDFFENIDTRNLVNMISENMNQSDIIDNGINSVTMDKFAAFMEYCMRGDIGIPQSDNNYMANFLADLYLKFWDLSVEEILRRYKSVEDFKIIRYVDDTYLFLKFSSSFSDSSNHTIILSAIEEVSDLSYKDFGLRINAKSQAYWLNDTDSVCFANNPELHRIAGSTSGTRFAPTRVRSD